MEITIKMKKGGEMRVEADAHAYHDSDGAGQRYTVVEDLVCYWPGKGRKRREIPPALYDVQAAEEEFWDASENGYSEARADAILEAREARALYG